MLQLSNPVSRRMTHHLRARHDAILVGINTVLTDDPQLTVRLTAGSHPRPIVIDGCLRMPLDARLLAGPGGRPIVATAETACTLKEERLREAGAFVMRLPCGSDGRVDLTALLERLAALKINSLMVEGGAGILSSFLNERLADQVVVTVSPRFVGGVPAVAAFGSGRARPMPRIRNVRYQPLAGDLIVWGDLKRTRARPARGDGL
jgi:3,4-dihydroxy 2-butanone 4-phosphate synthase/GTP cyclohydrolase II